MRSDLSRHDVEPEKTTAKKTYGKPRIEDYGSIVELTGSGAGSGNDGSGDPFASSGAAG